MTMENQSFEVIFQPAMLVFRGLNGGITQPNPRLNSQDVLKALEPQRWVGLTVFYWISFSLTLTLSYIWGEPTSIVRGE